MRRTGWSIGDACRAAVPARRDGETDSGRGTAVNDMPRERAPLVVGIGNILLRDEGVGVSVVRRLEADDASSLPAGTRLVDGGTLGVDLLPLIETADPLVLVDALDLGREPGSVAVLRGGDLEAALGVPRLARRPGVGDLVAAARLLGILPKRVSLVGVQPAEITVGLDLSAAVAAAVPRAAALARAELAAV